MRGAIVALLFVCLLVAVPATAAAYEPFNGFALEPTFHETKIIAKEEVSSTVAVENVAILVDGKQPGLASFYFTDLTVELDYMMFYGQPVMARRSDRVSSRFG